MKDKNEMRKLGKKNNRTMINLLVLTNTVGVRSS